ncbi:hypothetical protein [Bacillus sp. NEAU-Y102]
MSDSSKYNITTWFGLVVIVAINVLGYITLLDKDGGVKSLALLTTVCLAAIGVIFWIDRGSIAYMTRSLVRKDKRIRRKLLPHVSDFETKRYKVYAFRYVGHQATFENTMDYRDFDYVYEDDDLHGGLDFYGVMVGYIDENGEEKATVQPVIVKGSIDLNEPVLEVKVVRKDLQNIGVREEINPELIVTVDWLKGIGLKRNMVIADE